MVLFMLPFEEPDIGIMVRVFANGPGDLASITGRVIPKVIYKAFCLDVAQGHMKGAPNETRNHSCRFASRAC